MEESENNISIGPEKWIDWVDFNTESVEPIRIDHLIDPLTYFLRNMESECVPECCGIHAFGFWEKDILNAVKWSDEKNIKAEITETISKLSEYDGKVLVSSYLNQLIHQKTLIDILKHMGNVLNNTQQSV